MSRMALPRLIRPASTPSGLWREPPHAILREFASASATPSCGATAIPGSPKTAQEALDALVRTGAVAQDFALPEAEGAYAVFLEGGLSAIELHSFLDRELPDWLPQLDPVITPALHAAESLSARDYLARGARLRALAQRAVPRLTAVDVIASPTLCLTPPLMSDVADAASHLRVNRCIVRNTVAVNYLGLCAITMPVGRDRAGMPAEPCPGSSAMAIRRQPGPR